jgi:predicted transcriptional regulator YheO
MKRNIPPLFPNMGSNPIKESKPDAGKYRGKPFYLGQPFSDEDKRFLQGVASLLPGLSALLGRHCEIVLNSLEDPARSVVASHNAALSHRNVGTPISEHGLTVVSDILSSGDSFLCHYPRGLKGERVKAVIIPVLNAEGRCLGALTAGINLEMPLADFMKEYYPQISPETGAVTVFGSSPVNVIDELVTRFANEAHFEKGLKQRDRVKFIVNRLEQHGIFQLREAIGEVSRRLGVNHGTTYMHLRAIRGKNKRQP